MARRKAARKCGKKVTCKSIQAPKFPADHLPSELIHMIFTYLEPTEAAAFRWLGRITAEIGLQYLAPTVYLTLNEESYDRLLAIAEHPVVSKYVVKLEYETEGLRRPDRESFDSMFRKKIGFMPRRYESERPSRFASARTWRSYERDSVRNIPLPSQRQTKELLNRAWSMYEASHISQKKVKEANCFPERLVVAMKQFRNLKKVSTSADSFYKRYVAPIKDLLPTYSFLYGPYPSFRSAADATSSVLLAAESADLRVDSFACERLDWHFFLQDNKNFAALKRSMLYLKSMNIEFSIRKDVSHDHLTWETDFIRGECLEKGRVLDLITSAPDLEHLGLIFERCWLLPIVPMLKEVIGNFYWSSLKLVSLEGLSSGENDLVEFCKRHAHTLRDLSLNNMRLYQGSWHVTFHSMRRAFRLG